MLDNVKLAWLQNESDAASSQSQEITSYETERSIYRISFDIKNFQDDSEFFEDHKQNKFGLIIHTKHFSHVTGDVTRISYFLGEFYRKVDAMIFAEYVVSVYEKVGLAACPIVDPEHYLLG